MCEYKGYMGSLSTLPSILNYSLKISLNIHFFKKNLDILCWLRRPKLKSTNDPGILLKIRDKRLREKLYCSMMWPN